MSFSGAAAITFVLIGAYFLLWLDDVNRATFYMVMAILMRQ
jgi:hypothetical protein